MDNDVVPIAIFEKNSWHLALRSSNVLVLVSESCLKGWHNNYW